MPLGATDAPRSIRPSWPDQIRQALVGLGWTPSQADSAVAALSAEVDAIVAGGGAVPAVPVLLKQAIRLLGSAR